MNEVIQIFRSAMQQGETMKKYDNLDRTVGRLMDSLQYNGNDHLTIVTYSYLEKVSYSYYRRLKTEKELIVDTLDSIIRCELDLLDTASFHVKDAWVDNYGWYLKNALENNLTYHLPERSRILADAVGCGFASHVHKLDDGQIAIRESLKEIYDKLIVDPDSDITLLAHENIESFLQHLEEWKEKHVDLTVITWKIGESS